MLQKRAVSPLVTLECGLGPRLSHLAAMDIAVAGVAYSVVTGDLMDDASSRTSTTRVIKIRILFPD